MIRILKKTTYNILFLSRNLKISALSKINDYGNIAKRTQIKSEEEIRKIIIAKMKEYQVLINCESPECEEICKEICEQESKLRKSYGFDPNENLTAFPEFKFQDPEIDNQLD